ncbi:MAG TPA: hypothetical protein PKW95_14780 [bacterium]|nr:hypothetical protein [bacterium]
MQGTIRNGIGNGVEEFGQYYTDKLLVQITKELAGGNIENLEDLHNRMCYLADNGDLGVCPIGSNGDCADNITAAFNRHGVCTSFPCAAYIERNCYGIDGKQSCEDVPCLNNKSYDDCDNVFQPSGGRCSRDDEEVPTCCSEACIDNWDNIEDCGLFASQTACINDCINNEWNYTHRACMHVTLWYPEGCNACNSSAP